MPASERARRYRATGAAAGLVRVEVLVPPEGREAILAAAARLRDEYRRASPGTGRNGWRAEYDPLYEEAVRRFGTSCLWNAKPSRSVEGLRAIARQLKTYGGMDAWRCAERIEEAIRHALG